MSDTSETSFDEDNSARPESPSEVKSEKVDQDARQAFHAAATRPRDSGPDAPSQAAPAENVASKPLTKEEIPNFIRRRNRARRIVQHTIAHPDGIHRAMGVPLFASVSEIKDAAKRATRDINLEYNPHRQDSQSTDVNPDALGAINRIQESTNNYSMSKTVAGKEIVEAQNKRLQELDDALQELETKNSQGLVSDVASSLNGDYTVSRYKDTRTGEVRRISHRGEQGIETALRRSKQEKARIIHPATLVRDGLATAEEYDELKRTGRTNNNLLWRANRAYQKLDAAYDQVQHDIEGRIDSSLQTTRADAQKRRAEQQQQADEQKRREEAADQARKSREAQKEEEERRRREKAERTRKEQQSEELVKQTKRDIRTAIQERLHSTQEITDRFLEEEKERVRTNTRNRLILAYNDTHSSQLPIDTNWIQKHRDRYPQSASGGIFEAFYSTSTNQTKVEMQLINRITNAIGERDVLAAIDDLVQFRIDTSQINSLGLSTPYVFFHPTNRKWYSVDETDPSFGKNPNLSVSAQTPSGETVLVLSPDGYRKWRQGKNRQKATATYREQFSNLDDKVLADITLPDGLTLKNTQRTDTGYFFEGELGGKRYTVQLSSDFRVKSIDVS